MPKMFKDCPVAFARSDPQVVVYHEELDAAVKSAEGGVFYSGEAIFNWMCSWGRDGELPSPTPDVYRKR